VVVFLVGAGPLFAQQSAEEQAVWKLEHAYWEDVKANDLASYRALWHENFVGWPRLSARPARKDHITDWITGYTATGLHLDSYELKPADSQVTGGIVVACYWLTSDWIDKDGRHLRGTMRITHTWVRMSGGWQIISGMSGTEPETH
jgi:ketosteroid isomerase-like protein